MNVLNKIIELYYKKCFGSNLVSKFDAALAEYRRFRQNENDSNFLYKINEHNKDSFKKVIVKQLNIDENIIDVLLDFYFEPNVEKINQVENASKIYLQKLKEHFNVGIDESKTLTENHYKIFHLLLSVKNKINDLKNKFNDNVYLIDLCDLYNVNFDTLLNSLDNVQKDEKGYFIYKDDFDEVKNLISNLFKEEPDYENIGKDLINIIGNEKSLYKYTTKRGWFSVPKKSKLILNYLKNHLEYCISILPDKNLIRSIFESIFDKDDFIEVALFSKYNFLTLVDKLSLFDQNFNNFVVEQFITTDENIDIINGFNLEIDFIISLLDKVIEDINFSLSRVAKLFVNYKDLNKLYNKYSSWNVYQKLVTATIHAKIENNKPIDVINVGNLYYLLNGEFVKNQNNLTNDLHFYNDANKDIIKNKFIELEKETTDFGQTARINNLLNHIK